MTLTADRYAPLQVNNHWIITDAGVRADIILPAAVQTSEAALAWWAAHGHELDPDYTPPPTDDDVRAEAQRRILAVYPLWRQANIIREGGGDLTAMGAWIDSVRAASDVMEPAPPADYADDKHWPNPPEESA